MNEVRDILSAAANSSVVGVAVSMIDETNAKVRAMKEAGERQKKIDVVRSKASELLSAKMFDVINGEKIRLTKEIEKRRTKYITENDRRTARRSFELTEAQVKFNAMTPEEIKSQLESAVNGEFIGTDPLILDALQNIANTKIDPGEVASYRKILKERRYDEPWIQTPGGRDLVASLEAYQRAKAREIPMFVREDGRLKSTMLDVNEIARDLTDDNE